MEFKTCASPEQPSCKNPEPEESESECVESCVCKEGTIISGVDQCIPAEQCGCEMDGLYYTVSFFPKYHFTLLPFKGEDTFGFMYLCCRVVCSS